MPKPYPEEFREDVVRVARNRPDGVMPEQVAADFGAHPMTLSKWLRVAAVKDGTRPDATRAEQTELRELRKRNKLLEQEKEVLRRAAAYLSQANLPGKALPARERAGRRRDRVRSPAAASPLAWPMTVSLPAVLVLPRWRRRPARPPALWLTLTVVEAILGIFVALLPVNGLFRLVIAVTALLGVYLGLCRFAFERRRAAGQVE